MSCTRRKFIKTSTLATSAIIFGCSLKNQFDIIVKNVLVIDGTGGTPYKSDIGIEGNKISAIGVNLGSSADLIIDGSDLAISPGFIDIHTHTDTELIVDPKGESKIYQGVTTEIGGNCGYSPFPLNEQDFTELNNNLEERYNTKVDWRDINGFFESLERGGISINYASFTGHGNLRSFVVGKNDVKPDAMQLKQMKNKLAESIEMGSLGLSSGLEYAPGSYAETDELIELSKLVADKNGVYASHIRNEDDKVEEAVAEAIEIAEKSGVSLQISHLKAANPSNWQKVDKLLEKIDSANQVGISVHADRYPYIAYSTGLSTFLPLWARQGNTEEIISRLSEFKLLPKIKEYAESRAARIGGWNNVVLSSIFNDKNKLFEGKNIMSAAKQKGVDEFEFIRNLLVEERNRVSIIGFAMSEDNLRKILSHELLMIGSDGNAVSTKGKLSHGKPHPRYYGTFPRILGKYVRDEKLFDLATGIKKMTSMPAEKLGLNNRGKLKKGYYADLVLFNPNEIIDKSTFTEPHQLADGIKYVLVNGKVSIENGVHSGELKGRIIRHKDT